MKRYRQQKQKMACPIKKPLLAVHFEQDNLRYPVYATPKIDGIRCLKVNDVLVSRSFKPLKNKYIIANLSPFLPEGSDGELILPNSSFQDTTSFVNSHNPGDPKETLCFYWFDYVKESLSKGYLDRMKDLERAVNEIHQDCKVKIIPLLPKKISNLDELNTFEKECLERGYEGIMLRDPNGVYKCGRSTVKQQILLKVKRFLDTEAKIVGFNELYHNENEAEKNELNLTSRSAKKEGLVEGNILGSFRVEMVFNDIPIVFDIGTGFTQEERQDFWNNRENLLGRLVKFKYFDIGVKDTPRHPVFLGIREPDDM